MRKWLAAFGFLMAARVATAQNPDPREHNFTFSVDGTQIGGVVGYRIGFSRNPTARSDSRRLDL